MGSSRFVDVHKWVGQGAAPLDPLSMQYRAKLADDGARQCAGCLFKGQNWRVCVAAAGAAVKSGMRDCDDRDEATSRTFVYVIVETDPRQLDIMAIAS